MFCIPIRLDVNIILVHMDSRTGGVVENKNMTFMIIVPNQAKHQSS